LHSSGFLTDDLTDRHTHKGARKHTSRSYMGVCRLPGPDSLHRRIDIKLYERREPAFAILYFTGSKHFNMSMRLYAHKLGHSLSDHGLVPVSRVGREKHEVGPSKVCLTEKDIFDKLGLDYRAPKDREVDAEWLAHTSLKQADIDKFARKQQEQQEQQEQEQQGGAGSAAMAAAEATPDIDDMSMDELDNSPNESTASSPNKRKREDDE